MRHWRSRARSDGAWSSGPGDSPSHGATAARRRTRAMGIALRSGATMSSASPASTRIARGLTSRLRAFVRIRCCACVVSSLRCIAMGLVPPSCPCPHPHPPSTRAGRPRDGEGRPSAAHAVARGRVGTRRVEERRRRTHRWDGERWGESAPRSDSGRAVFGGSSEPGGSVVFTARLTLRDGCRDRFPPGARRAQHRCAAPGATRRWRRRARAPSCALSRQAPR